ncbi:F-box-like protein [Quillaja saponaria]|uniref:F-box protein n=1 Tax=Quillaja saponaria TaxID=32244 RepID=A0AAD7LWB8_QUISA|nr:F-box-like protein [Quillaja saponaria]
MERLPVEILLQIFCFLDHQSLAVVQKGLLLQNKTSDSFDWKWKLLGSDNTLWADLFKERWGDDRALFHAPVGSKSWKDVYVVQDRCDRVGLGLKIIREGSDYYLVHQGVIQRYLGSRRIRKQAASHPVICEEGVLDERSCRGILDKILFFIGDLEVASADAKRGRVL